MTMIPAWIDGELVPVEKLEVHRRGLRHKAVSVFLFSGEDVLIQRRALGKYHSPGLWANTCCSHPHWGESAPDCAARRLNEELGIAGLDLVHETSVEYRTDVGRGLIEHECVEIFFGRLNIRVVPMPEPDEVMDTLWIDRSQLADLVLEFPEDYAPWFRVYSERGLLGTPTNREPASGQPTI